MIPGSGAQEEAGGLLRLLFVLFAAAGLALGVAMLAVPSKDPDALPHRVCYRDAPTWLGCTSGMWPWLPFAGVAGGALGLWLGLRPREAAPGGR